MKLFLFKLLKIEASIWHYENQELCSSKDTIKRKKTQGTHWKNGICKTYLLKDSFKIHKKLLQIIKNAKDRQLRLIKDSNRHFTKEDGEMPNEHIKFS